ncbi:hypothetical protein ACFQRL_13395 [Microbacterium fluvii]|uniref:DoxX family protein n=1 Tax=Microbacterium fluvii TaxID=415215 RepID=A0ABW2HF56_9MICO|nr:hypothetical protein [Microbacterium fluvii]MCU4673585.1 hypothetical protein [Microbacterium fluvii]
MAPLVTLVVVTAAARLVGLTGVTYVDTWPEALAVGLAAMFLLTASAHFARPRRAGLIAIVPPAIPRPGLVVTATGLLEIAGAIGLLVSPTWIAGIRTAAAICLALLLLVLFPANVYAARARRHPDAPHTPLVPRTLMQVAFVAAAVVVAVTA